MRGAGRFIDEILRSSMCRAMSWSFDANFSSKNCDYSQGVRRSRGRHCPWRGENLSFSFEESAGGT